MTCCNFDRVPTPPPRLARAQQVRATTHFNVSCEAVRECLHYCFVHRILVFLDLAYAMGLAFLLAVRADPTMLGGHPLDAVLRILSHAPPSILAATGAALFSATWASYIFERRWYGVGEDAAHYDAATISDAAIAELHHKRQRACMFPGA